MKNSSISPTLQALAAALFFGASAPLSKILLGKVEPVILAGLLYLGSGLGAVLLRLFRRAYQPAVVTEAGLKRKDVPWLIGATVAGGILGPILLLFGLSATPAATASLLLNFESVATAVIAAVVFREAIGRRVWWAVGLVTLGSMVLSLNITGNWGVSIGAFGVLGACFLWGLDNNFTRNVSGKDPLAIVSIKGLAAGSFSLVLGLFLKTTLPDLRIALLALLVGSLCYGFSIALFVMAMRNLGAARTGALFATAPFIGALLSFFLLLERPSVLLLVSLPLMVAGASLLLGEDHAHLHEHPLLEHEHGHAHPDSHHRHPHPGEIMPENHTHSHWHAHPPEKHAHGHTPDLHHRHNHEPLP
ncbi:MAG TPA: EamA family transporter [Anaerolineales bacterium]